MVDEDCNMDFKKQINNTNEPTKDLVDKVKTHYKGAILGKEKKNWVYFGGNFSLNSSNILIDI